MGFNFKMGITGLHLNIISLGDTQFADIAEARLFAQLHSDFVDVLENFRAHDSEETGCVHYSDFRVRVIIGFFIDLFTQQDCYLLLSPDFVGAFKTHL